MKYIRCGNCNNLIPEGETVYRMEGLCGIFCSTECFADAHAVKNILTEELADDCMTEMITAAPSFATPGQIARRNYAPYLEGTVLEIIDDVQFMCLVQGVHLLCHKDYWRFSDV